MMRLFFIQFESDAVVVIAEDEKAAVKDAAFYNRADPVRVVEVRDNSFRIAEPYRVDFEETVVRGTLRIEQP